MILSSTYKLWRVLELVWPSWTPLLKSGIDDVYDCIAITTICCYSMIQNQ